jgi:hypothetical protein
MNRKRKMLDMTAEEANAERESVAMFNRTLEREIQRRHERARRVRAVPRAMPSGMAA